MINIIWFAISLALLPKIFGLANNLFSNLFNVFNSSINSWFQPKNKDNNNFQP